MDRLAGLKAAIIIGNSEVGMGSVSVEPFVLRKSCTNDLIVSREKVSVMLTLISQHMSRRRISGCEFNHGRIPKNPRGTDRARQFSQKLTDEVVSGYLVEPEKSRFGIINAFINEAQKLGPLQRIEVERFAGLLLEAPL